MALTAFWGARRISSSAKFLPVAALGAGLVVFAQSPSYRIAVRSNGDMTATIALLVLAQAAAYSVSFLVTMTLPLTTQHIGVGAQLGTVPNGVMLLGTITGSLTVARLRRQDVPFRRLFPAASVIVAVAAALTLFAIRQRSFLVLVVSAFAYGLALGVAMWLRFARPTSANIKPAAFMGLMTGSGLLAAVFAPSLIVRTGEAVGPALSRGHYVAAALGILLAAPALRLAPDDARKAEAPLAAGSAQIWRFLPPALACGAAFFVMGAMMAGTPLTMHACGFGLHDVASVYRGHLIAMFAPSLVLLPLMAHLRAPVVAGLGLVVNLAALVAGMQGEGFLNFWLSMALDGAGWSLTFVGSSALVDALARSSGARWASRFNVVCVLSNAAGAFAGGLSGSWGWTTTLAIVTAVLALATLAASGVIVARSPSRSAASSSPP